MERKDGKECGRTQGHEGLVLQMFCCWHGSNLWLVSVWGLVVQGLPEMHGHIAGGSLLAHSISSLISSLGEQAAFQAPMSVC